MKSALLRFGCVFCLLVGLQQIAIAQVAAYQLGISDLVFSSDDQGSSQGAHLQWHIPLIGTSIEYPASFGGQFRFSVPVFIQLSGHKVSWENERFNFGESRSELGLSLNVGLEYNMGDNVLFLSSFLNGTMMYLGVKYHIPILKDYAFMTNTETTMIPRGAAETSRFEQAELLLSVHKNGLGFFANCRWYRLSSFFEDSNGMVTSYTLSPHELGLGIIVIPSVLFRKSRQRQVPTKY